MPEKIFSKDFYDKPLPTYPTNVHTSPLEPDRLDLNLYNEEISKGINMKGINSNLGLMTALDNKKAEQQEKIIFGIEILGVILVILAVFFWLRTKYK